MVTTSKILLPKIIPESINIAFCFERYKGNHCLLAAKLNQTKVKTKKNSFKNIQTGFILKCRTSHYFIKEDWRSYAIFSIFVE